MSGRDRFSALPVGVIHQILSFLLTTKDVVATSVLSKSLRRAYSSFPITDFSASNYGCSLQDVEEGKFGKFLNDRRNFFVFVGASLARQLKKYSCIKRFHLSLSLQFANTIGLDVYEMIDDLLPFVTYSPHALDCIHLDLTTVIKTGGAPFDYKYLYPVPETLSSNCFACTSLGFVGCSFRALDDSTLRWPSLQVLSIDHSYVADSMIRNLGSICPLLHTLTLSYCTGMASFNLVGLDKFHHLKLVDNNFTDNTIIKIDHAPSLQYLYCRGIRKGFRIHIHLGRCEKLEVLKIKTIRVHSPLLQHILSPALPALKVLVVTFSVLQTRIYFSSLSLEKLKLTAPNLQEIGIRAPSLRSFKFIINSDSNTSPGLFSVDTTSLSQVVFSFYPSMELVTYRFPDDLEGNVAVVPSLPCIKNLELKIAHTTEKLESPVVKSHEALVDGLLWMCHPESIYLELGYGSNSDCIVAFIRKLRRHIYEPRDCCSDTYIRCWRHDLEDFEMECLGQNGRRKVLPRSSNSLQCLAPEDKICFRLRWRTM
ncbi:hypothetical protein Tsubulata_032066 [Turnera subulata]|uniref:F-box/LRR-repeat protein 15/At3g58940/PEG3-like LRR domain-containing protein n=1 Tax=Turnera subulata TaxID=218843 RepID=A0A9Q0FDT2_9ROSI|nr:hypothetical protein Tsubulata_032066 [Turnera subulata]